MTVSDVISHAMQTRVGVNKSHQCLGARALLSAPTPHPLPPYKGSVPNSTIFPIFIYLSIILPGKLTENTFSFAATTWGIVTGERRGMNEPIVNWGLFLFKVDH